MEITEILLIILIILVIILIFLVVKKNNTKLTREMRQELSSMFMQTREEISKNIGAKLVENANMQQVSIANLTTINETKLENIRKTVDDRMILMQKDNSEKLEKMRLTVDEKLHDTLEKRLGESFKLVNERKSTIYSMWL